jgi:hypothetical protein
MKSGAKGLLEQFNDGFGPLARFGCGKVAKGELSLRQTEGGDSERNIHGLRKPYSFGMVWCDVSGGVEHHIRDVSIA